MRILKSLTVLAVLGVAACDNPLDVDNDNQPERERVFRNPADVESFVASGYSTIHQGSIGQAIIVAGSDRNDALQPQLQILGMESYSGNANYGMAVRSPVPRNFIDNSPGNQTQVGNYRDWVVQYRAAASAVVGLGFITRPDFFAQDAGRKNRLEAYARFVLGVAMGNIALAYDQGSFLNETQDPATPPTFVGYKEVMDSAISQLDRAIAIAEGTAAFTDIPASWFAQDGPMNRAAFARLAKSYRARFRAGVARSEADRAAVDWPKVIADAEAGITADFQINMNPSAGWMIAWPVQHYIGPSWHQMWMFMIGMADSTTIGGVHEYELWLNTPNDDKDPFVVHSADRRFPSGTTRDDQVVGSAQNAAGLPYIQMRQPGTELLAMELATSYYAHNRFRSFQSISQTGPFPVMTKAEIDLLAAEGYLRQNQIPQAIAKIDIYRTRAGLPALAGSVTDADDPVPGGNACVPRVPVATGTTWDTQCGDVFEALKWEFRMETAFTGYGMWFFAGRGWGDLPEGTPLHFPVPFQELQVRQLPIYNVGGVGEPDGAPRGNYGL